jgi:hypothetical protein
MKGNQVIVNVYLDPDQYQHLKQVSEVTGAPMAHWIRRGVNKVLAEHGFTGYNPMPFPPARKKK